MIHPADRRRVAEFVDLGQDRGDEVHELELRVQTRPGDYRDILLRRAQIDAPETESGHYFHSVVIDISALRQAEARSRAAVDQLVRASEEEQARLAVELHDDTLQVMIAVLLQLQRVQPEQPTLVSAAEMLEGAIDRTRRLMFEIRPAALEREGLAAMISRVARDGPWLSAQVDIAIGRQSGTVEALCYRSLRELIVNARKHSQARRCASPATTPTASWRSPSRTTASDSTPPGRWTAPTSMSGWPRWSSGCAWPAATSRSSAAPGPAPRSG